MNPVAWALIISGGAAVISTIIAYSLLMLGDHQDRLLGFDDDER